MLLLILLSISGPCDSLATSPVLRTVQQSAAFAGAVRALPDSTPPSLQALCADLALSPIPLPGGASFVSGLAVPAFEPTYATFAVRGDSVWLLNPIHDGVLVAGLDISQWNAAVAGRYAIESDSTARYYARGIGAMHTNWGPRPYPFCGRDSLDVAQPTAGHYRVVDWLLLTAVAFGSDATLVGVDDLDCQGITRSPR